MIEGIEPGEDRGALRSPSDDGVSLASSVSPRAPASDKPRSLSGIVEADETFVLESFKGRRSDLPTQGAKARAERPAILAFTRTTFPSSSPATGTARPSTPILPQVDRRLGQPRPRRNRHAGQSSRRRRRPSDRRLRPSRRDCLPHRAVAGQAVSRGAAPAHQQRQRLPRPSQAMAQPLQRRRHQEPAQSTSAGGAPSKPGVDKRRTAKLDPQALSETDHTNR